MVSGNSLELLVVQHRFVSIKNVHQERYHKGATAIVPSSLHCAIWTAETFKFTLKQEINILLKYEYAGISPPKIYVKCIKSEFSEKFCRS